MPDMAQAKKIVKRRYRVVKRLIAFELAFWAICVAAVADDIGWNLALFALAYLGALAIPYVFILRDLKTWRVARCDLKNHRLMSKKTTLTVARYQLGYRGSFSAHLVDRDRERYPLFVPTSSQALFLSSWLKNVPATIDYLEGSHFAVTVYLDVPATRMIPEELASLFEENEGYTQFIKGKKKENT